MNNNYNDFKKYAVHHAGITSTTFEDYEKLASGGLGITNMTPNIVEEKQLNVAVIDVFSRIMKERIIFLGMGIDDQVANIVIAQLLYLESVDGKKDISIYVNSPGGSVYAGLGIYDTMNYISPDVSTITVGMAASMGYVLATAGAKGKRFALKNSQFMQHQPMGGIQGQASDIEITARQIMKVKKTLYGIISEATGKSIEQIEKDADRDHWMDADEAVEYGVIDKVLTKKIIE